jgi:hypothetical protein
MQLSFYSVAVVLTRETIRINIHKRNNTKTQYANVKHSKNVLPKHPHITKPTLTHSHILQNKLKQPQYNIHTK